jgi:cytochrome b6-f complex iron-sulfur subunit
MFFLRFLPFHSARLVFFGCFAGPLEPWMIFKFLPRFRFVLAGVLALLLSARTAFPESADASSKSLPLIAWIIIPVAAFFAAVLLFLTLKHFLPDLPIPGPKPVEGKRKTVHGVPAAVTKGARNLNPAITRRSFITLLGWAWIVFTAATMGALTLVLRFFFPNVTFEPPPQFTAGFPDQFAVGVDERFKNEHRVWIVRDDRGFYALSTICTHLGCTPNWLQTEQKFKCPCHGSGYYVTGINFEGPAPRPLERFKIGLAEDGQILVDESVKYQQELGQWDLPGSFLDYKV